MKRIDDIPYASENGFRGLGDLFLPENPKGAPAALVIHGGGWNAMDKMGLRPVSVLAAELGYGVFAINYRLLDDAPWPACGDDCMRAAEFLMNAEHPEMEQLDRSQLTIIGASAGGHLAVWTGLKLPPEQVRAIINLAGPMDLRLRPEEKKWSLIRHEGATEEDLYDASPVSLVAADAPPLTCIHSVNDELVRFEHSEAIVEAYHQVGAEADLIPFDGPDDAHGFWEPWDDSIPSDQRILIPAVQGALEQTLQLG